MTTDERVFHFQTYCILVHNKNISVPLDHISTVRCIARFHYFLFSSNLFPARIVCVRDDYDYCLKYGKWECRLKGDAGCSSERHCPKCVVKGKEITRETVFRFQCAYKQRGKQELVGKPGIHTESED